MEKHEAIDAMRQVADEQNKKRSREALAVVFVLIPAILFLAFGVRYLLHSAWGI